MSTFYSFVLLCVTLCFTFSPLRLNVLISKAHKGLIVFT